MIAVTNAEMTEDTTVTVVKVTALSLFGHEPPQRRERPRAY